LTIYADASMARGYRQADLLAFARAAQQEITFQRLDGYSVSAADVFGLLTSAAAAFVETNTWPATVKATALDGPARPYVPSTGGTRSSSFPGSAFARAVRDTSDFIRTSRRVPDEVWIGPESLSPADYLATLAKTVEDMTATGNAPSDVMRREGRFTADRYVAEDSPALWNWVIFPEGFHAPRIMELARLQAWTLKPAVMQH
jgi:hypothetical protein